MLKIWDWMSGIVKHEIQVWDTVEPYIRIRSSKRKRGADAEDASEARRRGRGKKAKAKGKAKAEAETTDAGETPPVAETSDDTPTAPIDNPVGVEENVEKVLVINKIETTASRRIIFSAVG